VSATCALQNGTEGRDTDHLLLSVMASLPKNVRADCRYLLPDQPDYCLNVHELDELFRYRCCAAEAVVVVARHQKRVR
jgi:hypothetical protein